MRFTAGRALLLVLSGLFLCASCRARNPADAYELALPAGWRVERANQAFNHLKARAPAGYGSLSVGTRANLLGDELPAARFADAWAMLDDLGTEAFTKQWAQAEEADGRATCEVLGVERSMVDTERAVEVRFHLLAPERGANLMLRALLAIHDRQWFLFGFAASVDDEPRYRKVLDDAANSIRWR